LKGKMMLETLITLLSYLSAGGAGVLLTAAWNYFVNKGERRRQYTTNLLLTLNSGIYLSPIAFRAFKLAETGRPVEEYSAAEIEDLEKTLDFLEFVAVCNDQKIVDLDTIVRQEGGPILNLHKAAMPWISAYRATAGSNAVYHEFEFLAQAVRQSRRRIYGGLDHVAATKVEPATGR
jgi:hypothetical protein